MQYVFDGNSTYPDSYDVIQIPNEGVVSTIVHSSGASRCNVNDSQWTYWVIQVLSDAPPVPHPIHLHGHDFFVLGSGSGTLDLSTASSSLNFDNPSRRDTAILPGGGYLVIAFEANNPGLWIMHCHIAWHISEGLGVQFMEAKGSMVMPDKTQFDSQCAKWRTYSSTMLYPQIDSGL